MSEKKPCTFSELEKLEAWIDGARSHGEPDESKLLKKLTDTLSDAEQNAVVVAGDFGESMHRFEAYLLGRRIGEDQVPRERRRGGAFG